MNNFFPFPNSILMKELATHFLMIFMQKKSYFVNFVSIVLTFLGLKQSKSTSNQKPILAKKKSSQLKQKTITNLLKFKKVQDFFFFFFFLKVNLANQSASIIADETTVVTTAF